MAEPPRSNVVPMRRDSKVVQRVALPDLQPFVTDGLCMGDKYLGKEKAANLHWWFRGRRGKAAIACNIISQILAVLGIFRLIDERFCFLIVPFTMDFVVVTISTSSAALFPRVVKAFDTVILLSTGLFAFGMMGLCLQDHRIGGVVGGFLGFTLVAISDAFPYRMRKYGVRVTATILFIILCLLLLAILTDSIPDWTDVKISFAGLAYSSTELCIMSLAQTCMFMFHFCWVAYRSPHCLVLMVSKVTTVRISSTEPRKSHKIHESGQISHPEPFGVAMAQVRTGDVEAEMISQAHLKFRKASLVEVKRSRDNKVTPQQGKESP
ncbi:hypothetical protein TrCOL_g9879 [Triparma columacea]|uniref:Uncharacterized protein n=1 Tax=Triparma columacea TaxID=722753 RepID=A0A9W7GK05_9STRA|nr:hypothetical protein TrCOL_g9879 [Triparma columacea]